MTIKGEQGCTLIPRAAFQFLGDCPHFIKQTIEFANVILQKGASLRDTYFGIMLYQLIDQGHVRIGFKGRKEDAWYLLKVFDFSTVARAKAGIGKIGERAGWIDRRCAQIIFAGLERQHESELARRQAALDAMARWAQTQQVINAINRPVITNCTRAGNFTNCMSQ